MLFKMSVQVDSVVATQECEKSKAETGQQNQKLQSLRRNNHGTSNTSNITARKQFSFKAHRKRAQSLSGLSNNNNYKIYAFKRRNNDFTLPSKFLLGGNIHDPLNLNSLQDEEINRAMNAVTPKSSPLPTPPRRKCQIEVIIPPNISDPLHLIDCMDDATYEKQLKISPIKKSHRKKSNRHKNKKNTSGMISVETDLNHINSPKKNDCNKTDVKKNLELELNKDELNIDNCQNTTSLTEATNTNAINQESQEFVQNEIVIPENKPEENPSSNKTPNVQLEIEKSNATIKIDKNNAEKLNCDKKDGSKQQKRKFFGDDNNNRDPNNLGQKKLRRTEMDKIVSPVIPQPGAIWKRNVNVEDEFKLGGPNKKNNSGQTAQTQSEIQPKFNEKNKQFQYGNYNRYYGYRNPNHEEDIRLKIISRYRHIFHGKDVLDIGCNIGHITLTLARDFGCTSVVGLDIDKKLIGIARKNIYHYMNAPPSACLSRNLSMETILQEKRKFHRKQKKKRHTSTTSDKSDEKNDDSSIQFPISMPLCYGPIDVPGDSNPAKSKGFPYNVNFVHGNYVLEDDSLLNIEQPQFDVILALSITKWLHLNWGDAGLKQAFRRMYAQLRPGGKLILEPQAWKSYVKKKSLTETIYKNYKAIEFFPQQFNSYLLSSEVGFAKSIIIGCPSNKQKGFQRPIFMFTKSNLT